MSLLPTVYDALFPPHKIPALVVTLDALGTLYKFREPVSTQYLKIAQKCGLRANVDASELDRSFKSSYKHYNTLYPNYGKGKLQDPEVWWTKVANRTFGQIIQDEIPPDLGAALYKHFSSREAYELYPDAQLFLHTMMALKVRYSDPDGPLLVTGVITNSDPRVRLVLEDMSISVGTGSDPLDLKSALSKSREMRSMGDFALPWKYNYDPRNVIDFLCTSYDANAEKPEPAIFGAAKKYFFTLPVSRAEQSFGHPSSGWQALSNGFKVLRYRPTTGSTMFMHIGDEYPKDYVGARRAGWRSLYLARTPPPSAGTGANVEIVSSLQEAAMAVSILAQEFFRDSVK